MLNLLLQINNMDNINDIHDIIKQYENFLFNVMKSKYFTLDRIFMIHVPCERPIIHYKFWTKADKKKYIDIHECLVNTQIDSFDELQKIYKLVLTNYHIMYDIK